LVPTFGNIDRQHGQWVNQLSVDAVARLGRGGFEINLPFAIARCTVTTAPA
jgi:hypothetical protein